MSIVVINAGSSSIKYSVYKASGLKRIDHSIIEEIANHHDGFARMELELQKHGIKISEIEAFVHRVVHGGEAFHAPVLIDEQVIAKIESLIPLAPLHNPANLEGIKAARHIAPNVAQFAVFDTAFHQNMPEYAYLYPIPMDLYHRHHIRRYGFHGTSHEYVAQQAAVYLNKPIGELNLITFHIGNGVSACAIQNGISIDTTMGMTPLEGLMMGTRSGSIDPSIIGYLMREESIEIDTIETILNKQSGLKAIARTNDLRTILEASSRGDESALLAIDMFTYRLKKQLGSYMAILDPIDAIVFTGGIGEHSSLIRERICSRLEHLGVILDNITNLSNASCISQAESAVTLLVIPTDEELQMARHVHQILFPKLS